ncbi:hypothetical protein VCHA53O466_50149 [Vibrio chagasii]|nr:hypothetical protein VCHA53O466_50149 [Vibrio chagasii]
MIDLQSEKQVKGLTQRLHKAVKSKPNMKLSEFREEFSKAFNCKDWNTLIAGLSGETLPQQDVGSPKYRSFADYASNGYIDFLGNNHNKLSPKVARAVADVVYKFGWWLAPIGDSIIEDVKDVYAFISEYPNHAMHLLIPVSGNHDCAEALVTGTDLADVSLEADLETFKVDFTSDSPEWSVHQEMDKIAKEYYGAFAFPPAVIMPSSIQYYCNHVQHDFDFKESLRLAPEKARQIRVEIKRLNKLDTLSPELADLELVKLDDQPFREDKEFYNFLGFFSGHPLKICNSTGKEVLVCSTVDGRFWLQMGDEPSHTFADTECLLDVLRVILA